MNPPTENHAAHRSTHPFLSRYGPWAVVTGASDGIGEAIARQLAISGFSLCLVARRESRLEALATELREAHGVATRVLALDLGEPAGVDELLRATRELEVGLVVAAAGFGTSGAFLESSLDDELAMLDLNCRSVATLCHHFARRLAARGRGGLILLSSLVAFQGVPRAANYAATKAYIQSLAEGLGAELSPLGVDVLASAPGPVHSGFAARARMTMGQALSPEVVARDTLRALGRKRTVWPGWLSKLLLGSLALLPRWGRVLVMTQVMAGMARPAPEALPSRP